jgi:polysaccharide export outer membrane protein
MTVRPFVLAAVCLFVVTTMVSAQEPTTKPVENSPESANAALVPSAVVPSATVTPSATAAPATPSAPVVPDVRGYKAAADYRIGPEDVLDILVWKNCPDLCRTVPVRPDGKLSLPLVNDVHAAGLTPGDLRQQLTERLTVFLPSPEVSVIVREVHSVKVAVVGAVKMPGHYEVNSPATVLELIARAQGLTEFASRDRIVVIRQNGATTNRIPFNYRKVAEGNEQDNFYVRPGDIIVVP